jgi:hypothetical protein
MVVVPAVTPDRIPVAETEATAVLLLVHTPPGEASVRVIVADSHTTVGPEMADATGCGFTVMGIVATDVPQPLVTL